MNEYKRKIAQGLLCLILAGSGPFLAKAADNSTPSDTTRVDRPAPSAGQVAGRPVAKSTLPSTVIGTSISAPSTDITSRGPVSYTVSFGTINVLTFTLGTNDVTLNKTGTASGIVSVSGSGNTRTVTLSRITGDGSLGQRAAGLEIWLRQPDERDVLGGQYSADGGEIDGVFAVVMAVTG